MMEIGVVGHDMFGIIFSWQQMAARVPEAAMSDATMSVS